MPQQSKGDRNIQIAVAQSNNISITIHGQHVVDLETRPYPRPLPPKHTEVDLLKAAHAQVPFVGRDDILQDFIRWCESDPVVSFRTLIGRGGAGKTRLAYELYARINKVPNWSAYFLHFLGNSAKGVDLWSEISSKNSLLIADYASDSPTPLADLLRPLTNSAPDGRRIRVLLLARTASWDEGWLASLTSERTGEEVDRFFNPRDPIAPPPLTPEQRYTIFEKTVEKAAEQFRRPIPALPSPDKFADSRVADSLADPLTLMMAALIALESDAAAALILNRTELASQVALKLVAGRMKVTAHHHEKLFLHMAAYATLIGGLSQTEALASLDEESSSRSA